MTQVCTSAWGHVASIASGTSAWPRRPSQHTISASFQASVAYLGKYRQPVFGAFTAVAEPYPQHVFTAVHVHSNHHVRWAVDNSSAGTDLDHHGIYVQNGITPVKRPVLPSL